MANAKMASLVGGSFVLLAAVIACVVVLVINKSEDAVPGLQVASKDIKDICQPTDYQKTCEEELTKAAGNQTDMKSLVMASFNVTIDHVRKAIDRSEVIKSVSKDPALASPLAACRELFDYTVEELQAAVEHVLQYTVDNLDKVVYEVMVWLSAANTYQVNCLDQFANQSADAAVQMKQALNRSLELTANALRITRNVGDMLSQFNPPDVEALDIEHRRRLLDDDHVPSWLTPERRRLMQLTPLQLKPTVVVAQDGSGQFTTVKDAIASLPKKSMDYLVVHVKAGVYKEKNVVIDSKTTKVVLIGDGPTKTRITGDLNFKRMGISTFHTATLAAVGNDFMVRDIGFENSAGPDGHQAVAFRCQSERSIMYNCHFDGYQDTLYAQSKTQYYRDCKITGTVDFIFGNAYAVFQNCLIMVRKPGVNQQNMITAHGSPNVDETTLYVIHNSTIVPDPELAPVAAQHPTFLGRPWKPFARTIYLQSQIDGFIHPDGWMPWQGSPDSIKTCFYAEIDCRGMGANKAGRVKWPGVKELSLDAAQRYTLDTVFTGIGADWVKASGAPFFPGLLQPNMPPNPVPLYDQSSNLPMNQDHPAPGMMPAGQAAVVGAGMAAGAGAGMAAAGGGGGGKGKKQKKNKKQKKKKKEKKPKVKDEI